MKQNMNFFRYLKRGIHQRPANQTFKIIKDILCVNYQGSENHPKIQIQVYVVSQIQNSCLLDFQIGIRSFT